MIGLLPIVRRVRRPLLPVEPGDARSVRAESVVPGIVTEATGEARPDAPAGGVVPGGLVPAGEAGAPAAGAAAAVAEGKARPEPVAEPPVASPGKHRKAR